MMGDVTVGFGVAGLWYLPIAFLAGVVFGLCRALLALGARVNNDATHLHEAQQTLEHQQRSLDELQMQGPATPVALNRSTSTASHQDSYETAIDLACRGVDAREIDAACGIGVAQAHLLIRIHGKEREIDRHPKTG